MTIFFIFVHPITDMAGYGQDTLYIIDVSLVSVAFSSLRSLLLVSKSTHHIMVIMHNIRGCSIAVGS